MLRFPHLFALLLCACGQPSDAPADAPPNAEESETTTVLVRTAPVLIRDMEEFVEAVANTHYLDQVDLFPERVEPVLALHVEEGEIVQKGQVLADLRKDVASLALDEAKAKAAPTASAAQSSQSEQMNLKFRVASAEEKLVRVKKGLNDIILLAGEQP